MKQPQQSRKCDKHPPVLKIIGHLYQPAVYSTMEAPVLQRSSLTFIKIAKLCGCTLAAVYRVRKAFDEGRMEAVEALKWGPGARYKEKLSTAQVAWLVNPDTLKQQAHMSLEQRAAALNVKFNQSIGSWDVRALYRGVGISKQRLKRALGPPNPTEKALVKQQLFIDTAKEKFERLSKLGYDIFQLDASVFSAKSFTPSAWALVGQPLQVPHKWVNKKYVAVFAAISERSGCLLQMYKLGKAFNAEDIDGFLERLRLRAGKHKKLAVFWDNASIHNQPGLVTAPLHRIEVIKNAPYRPDLNGIEFFWQNIKIAYRKELTRLRSHDLPWDQEELVKRCVRDVGFECARDSAAKGWRNLRKAVLKPPRLPDPNIPEGDGDEAPDDGEEGE